MSTMPGGRHFPEAAGGAAHPYAPAAAAAEHLTPPTTAQFAERGAQAEAERIGADINAIRVAPERRIETYNMAFRKAAHDLLSTYAVVGDDDSFDAAYRYAENEDHTLDRDRRGDLFEAYEAHPAMLAIDGLNNVLDKKLKDRVPPFRRVMTLLLEAYDAE